MKISDLVLMSDVDGTLLVTGEEVPRRNVEALERFTRGGGHFAIATGRSTMYTRELVEKLPVNYPCVVFNGGAIYDFTQNRYLMEEFLPHQAPAYLEELIERFPETLFSICNNDYYYDLTEEKAFAQQSRAGRINYTKRTTLSNLEGQWYKVVAIGPQEQANALVDYGVQRNFPGVRFVHTNASMIEMLPEVSSKGYALRRLMELEGFAKEQLVCIGDYYNDLEMLELAGLGVTLETSPADLQALAGKIVGPCEQGALADLVEYLEERYGY